MRKERLAFKTDTVMFWIQCRQYNSSGSPTYAVGSEGPDSVNRLPKPKIAFEAYPGQFDIETLSLYAFVFNIYV